MTYRQIFDEYEGKFRIQNKDTFRLFLEEFKEYSGIDWKIIVQNEHLDPTDYTNIFWSLHTALFNIDELKRVIPQFYQLLEKYHFNFEEDYISFARLIGSHMVDSLPNNVRNFVMKAPYIDDVSDNGGKVTIYSEKLGNITFYSTNKYFSGNYFMEALFRNNKITGECHNISWTLMDYMPGSTLVTSLIPSSFLGTTCYHTVIRDRDSLIVDAANSCVYEEADYHNLFHDEIICETKDTERHEALSQTSLLEGRGLANAMVLTLHKQQKKL